MFGSLQLKRIRLKLDEIHWPEERVRSVLEDHEKGVLKQSIKSLGLLHEIIVCRDSEGRWIGVAGYHRWEAMKQLGILEAEVKYFEPCDEKTMLIIQLVENFGRGKGDQYQLLQAIHTLATKYKMRLDDIAMLTGYSVSTLSKFLRVMRQAPPIVLEYIKQGKLTVWHALELLRLPSVADIVEYARLAAQYGWSIKELREAIDKYLEQIASPPIETVETETVAEEAVPPAGRTQEPRPEEESYEGTELVPVALESGTTTVPVAPAESTMGAHQEAPTPTEIDSVVETESESEAPSEASTPTSVEQAAPTVASAEVYQCAFCRKPIKGMPLRFYAHKECFRNAYMALNTLAQILEVSPKNIKLEQIAMLPKIVELAARYLEEHPEAEKELFEEAEENTQEHTTPPQPQS